MIEIITYYYSVTLIQITLFEHFLFSLRAAGVGAHGQNDVMGDRTAFFAGLKMSKQM